MNNDYLALFILVLTALGVGGAFIFLSTVLGPKKETPYKSSPYECGMTPVGDAKERFPIKFYLVAMLFILFDIEVVFLWSWLSVFKNADVQYQIYSFTAVMIYMVLWIIGDAYVLKMNAIDWDEGSISEE